MLLEVQKSFVTVTLILFRSRLYLTGALGGKISMRKD